MTFVSVGEITQGAEIINLGACEVGRLVVISISFCNHLEDGCMGIEFARRECAEIPADDGVGREQYRALMAMQRCRAIRRFAYLAA